jgi:hypothetical protein
VDGPEPAAEVGAPSAYDLRQGLLRGVRVLDAVGVLGGVAEDQLQPCSSARADDVRAMPTVVTSSTRRRSRRSANAPPHSAPKAIGTKPTGPAGPTRTEEPVTA